VLTGAATVRHSFCAGRPVVADGRLPGIDLAELRDEAERATARLIEGRRAALAAAN
jgi:hypothetical protein